MCGAESIGAVGAASIDLRVLPERSELSADESRAHLADWQWTCDEFDSMSDGTDTSACDACDGFGDRVGCEECYRGRVSGYREVRRWSNESAPEFVAVPCTPAQRGAVDAWYMFHGPDGAFRPLTREA